MTEGGRHIIVRPRLVVAALAATAGLLVGAYLVLLVIGLTTGHDHLFGIVDLFDLNEENNVPSFFSGSLFLVNALLFAFVWRTSPDPRRASWLLIAVVFVFLAYDELFSVHELLTVPLRNALHTSGVLFYPWFLAYLVPVALLAWRAFPVWYRLDPEARSGMAVAAVAYLSGAVGVEMAAGWHDDVFGNRLTFGSGLLVALEESLEMAGLILLLRTLLGQLGAGHVQVGFEDPIRRRTVVMAEGGDASSDDRVRRTG